METNLHSLAFTQRSLFRLCRSTKYIIALESISVPLAGAFRSPPAALCGITSKIVRETMAWATTNLSLAKHLHTQSAQWIEGGCVRKKASRSIAPPIWSPFDLTEGFFLSHALLTLERLGILDSLRKPLTAHDVAVKHQVNQEILEATLRMLAGRTSVVRYRSEKYQTTSAFDKLARFYLLQYAGSYGLNAHELEQILKEPAAGGRLVDREQHKRAFEQMQTSENDPLTRLVLQLDLTRVLDIGCGTANMLIYLAVHLKEFIGWGIDISPQMCAAARRKVAAIQNGQRIKIFRADSRQLKSALPARIIKQVQAITAKGVANEFFASGISEAVAWLSNIKAAFPGRTLLIADYYGQLGFNKKPGRVVGLHDYVQVISWQGVPPPDVAGWEKVYRAAKCKLIQTVEDLPNFIHVLKL